MGPRSEWEGRESETTRWLLGEQTTPVHAAAHASAPVQLERRLPWASVWRRKSVRAFVSFGCEEETEKSERARERRKR